MSVIGWMVVGLLAGGLGRRVVGAEKRGCLATMVIGVIGALIGGALYRVATDSDSDLFGDFDLGSVVVATIGAVVFLMVLNALDRNGK